MRFLLHVRQQTRAATPKKITQTPNTWQHETAKSIITTRQMNNDSIDQPKVFTVYNQKVWGQQCSPQCGCVLRFESEVDPLTDQITSCTHAAKRIITSKGSPVYTMSENPRPLLSKCTCKNLETLSGMITTYCRGRKVAELINETEFTGVRSSTAFRHTVLKRLNLDVSPTGGAKCYDLVEEAFLAMVRGHMPQPRTNLAANREKKVMKRRVRVMNMDEIWAKKQSLSYSDLLIDGGARHWHEQANKKQESRGRESDFSDEWLEFVDEQERAFEEQSKLDNARVA